MAIDASSLCPGGRGKIIRNCCPDHVKDLEQIDKMLEGEQFAAGLAFVESLEKKSPGCACLTEAKCLFQRMLGLWEGARETAAQFVAREPKNVVALSELAITSALLDQPQEAISSLVDAVESVEGDKFPVSIVQAMLTVGHALFESGRLYQAIAVAKQLQAFASEDRAVNQFLYRCFESDSVPLMLKEQTFDVVAPDDFEKKSEYESATTLLARGQWKKGRAILESLLPYADAWPNLLRNLGFVELWFANDEKGREYLERYLSRDGLDFESAVDVEQFLDLLEVPTWDDVVFMERRVCNVDDFDATLEKLLSSKRLIPSERLLAYENEGVRPRNAFALLDRAPCDQTIDLSRDVVARQLGAVFAFGKQTTRSARLEVVALETDFAAVESSLADALGTAPVWESKEKLEDQPTSWTTSATTPRFQFKDPSKITQETIEKLYEDEFKAFADVWFHRPLRVLGGKSPEEVLQTRNGARKVEAVVRLVCSLFSPSYAAKIGALLRGKTNLPEPAPIEPPENLVGGEETTEFFRRVPIWRWSRLKLERIPSKTLAMILQVANLAAPQDVKVKFARELVSRPASDVQYQDRAIAYSILADDALLNRDSTKALEIIAEAGAYAKSVGESDGQWKVLEVTTRFRRQEFEKVRSLSREIFRDYQDDRAAVEALRSFLDEVVAQTQAQMRLAEAYRLQSGQPSQPPVSRPTSSPYDETRVDFGVSEGLSGGAEGKRGGLWTPDSDVGGGSQGGGKLWTPD